MYILVHYVLMTYDQLKSAITAPVFSNFDVVKMFPQEKKTHINTQLSRFVKLGDLIGLKKGLYTFQGQKVALQVLANYIVEPSYVSLEYVLNNFGVIPDVVMNITNITTIKNKTFNTPLGTFLYHRLDAQLFFGFQLVKDDKSGLYYKQAYTEKALLDYIYLRKIKSLAENRIDLADMDLGRLNEYATHYPDWVRKVLKTV